MDPIFEIATAARGCFLVQNDEEGSLRRDNDTSFFLWFRSHSHRRDSPFVRKIDPSFVHSARTRSLISRRHLDVGLSRAMRRCENHSRSYNTTSENEPNVRAKVGLIPRAYVNEFEGESHMNCSMTKFILWESDARSNLDRMISSWTRCPLAEILQWIRNWTSHINLDGRSPMKYWYEIHPRNYTTISKENSNARDDDMSSTRNLMSVSSRNNISPRRQHDIQSWTHTIAPM